MRPPTARLGLALLAGLLACEHTTPGPWGPDTPVGPFGAGLPLRLTYNPGVDADPAWLPDGSGFLYSLEHRDRDDHDRCIAAVPGGGGVVETELCAGTVGSLDSLDVYEWPAPAADGRLAYVTASSPLSLTTLAPASQALVLGSLDRGGAAAPRVLLRMPYLAPSGRGHGNIAQLRWLGPDALVYLGEHVAYVAPCGSCIPDTTRTGLEIAKLDLATDPPTITVFPGTDRASSVWAAGDDTLYLTFYDDARVYRLIASTGAISVLHDFGVAGVARDPQAAAGRLVAIVGGSVTYRVDSAAGPIAHDHGGDLHMVDLATGTEVVFTVSHMFFRHPAFAPVGGAVVAEGYWFVVDTVRAGGQIVAIDTTFAKVPDLWRFRLQ